MSEICFEEIISVEKAVQNIIDALNTDGVIYGRTENVRFRFTGSKVDSSKYAEVLELANNERFDRWANSITARINLGMVDFEDGNMEKILKNAFNLYKGY